MQTSNVRYNKKHDLKRDARQKLFKFYLDDEKEREVFEILNESDNAKQLIIESVLQFVKSKN